LIYDCEILQTQLSKYYLSLCSLEVQLEREFDIGPEPEVDVILDLTLDFLRRRIGSAC
jgi:hypothetical protein